MVHDPDREEDEGYLAAGDGVAIDRNPYPVGTLRFDDWRRGWHTRWEEMRVDRGHPVLLADADTKLNDNPHPRGTIRYDEWRRAWLVKRAGVRRALRLAGSSAMLDRVDRDGTGR